MTPFTPRPRHLLVAGLGLGLTITASSGTGCGSRNQASAKSGRKGEPPPALVRNTGAEPTDEKAAARKGEGSERPAGRSAEAGRDGGNPVVKAIQEKVHQAEQVIDPSSVRRQSVVAKAPATASEVEWLSLGAAPQQTPKPADAASDPAPTPPAPDGANGTAAVAARPPVAAEEGIPSPRQEVADASITTSRDEGGALLQRVRDNPLDAAAHLDYQLYRFSVGEQVPHLASLSPLSGEDRDALVAVLDGLSNFRSATQAEPNALESKKIQPLMDMADRLRAQAELTLPTVSLCSAVKGFGVYEPLAPSLKAGQDHQVVLYVEVGNFSSRRNDQTQLWETKLKQEAVLYTESGLAVWTDKSDFPPDVSRNRRHDFYVVKKVTLPKALSIGRYFLKVTITDEQAKRVAENSLPLQVVAQ